MTDKLHISNEMAQLDLKNRGFYDELTDEERKKFSTFLMLRYGSSCTSGPVELQKYYVQSCNEQMNKHFFSLGKHPKLQWLMATTVSPGMGKQRHEWLAFKGKASKDKRANLLGQIYPHAKMADLEILSKTMSDADIKKLLLDRGWEDKKIKEALK
jgi:hypothetical protein